MAEHKKLNMLVKLDDGQTYTLGGDGADNAVTLDTEQTITGLKTFDKLPQSSVEPKADAELITKKFADSHYLPVDTKPHKYDILVKMKHDGTSWVGFSDFSVRLRDGTRLDIKHIENQSATTATQPVKAVFKTVKDLTARIEAPTQQPATFFDSYQLEAGEFTGTVSFYKATGKFGPASYDINPWYVYVGYGNGNNYDGIYAVSIDNLDKPLLGVNFKFGDAHTTYSYTCLQCGVVFTVDGSALEVAYDGDMSDSAEATIEYPINSQSMIGVVQVDNAQEITGAKTFTQNIKVTAKPKEATDVATVGYVSGLLNAKAPYDVTLDFKVEDDTDGGWVVYSNMEINLDNGKKLKCIHIDNTQPTSANAPVKAVFKAIPATEAINAAPTEQAPTFFDTYQLQDEEYLGTLTYGHILNSQLQDYASYKGPFHTNQYGTTCTIKEATQLRISISELPAAVSKVSLKFDSSYLPKTFKASLSGVGMDVTSNVLTNPSGNTPLELLFDVVKLTGLVTLDTAQTITGAKTFEKLPKSEATPVDDHELVNKAYVDAKTAGGSSTKTTSILFKARPYYASGEFEAGYHDLRISLSDNKHLVPLYLESTSAKDATEAVKVIYKVSDSEYSKGSIQTQAKDWFDTYELKEGELKGLIYYAKTLKDGLSNSIYTQSVEPFDDYAATGPNAIGSLIKFTFDDLPLNIRQLSFKIGARSDYKTIPQSIQIFGASGDESYTSAKFETFKDNFIYDKQITLNISFVKEDYVGLLNEQTIIGKKIFEHAPAVNNAPVSANDLVNKAYVEGLLNTAQKCVVRIKAKNVDGQNRLAITRPRLYLSNGTVLQATHVTGDGRQSTNYGVFKLVPTSDIEFPYPEKSTYAAMQGMIKNDPTLVFATIKMSNASDGSIPTQIGYPTAEQLFGANGAEFILYGIASTEVTPVTFEFSKLPAPVTSLGLYSHQNGKHVQSNTSEYKYNVDFGSKSAESSVVQTNTMEDHKYSTLEAAVANSIIDYTDVNQNITALKTFVVLPQSKKNPADEKDLVTKKFLDAAIAELDKRIKALEDAAPKP